MKVDPCPRVVLLFSLLVLCFPTPARSVQPSAAAMVGARAPGFSLTSVDGKTFTLAHLRGNVVVLNFWASWCPPCRAETPAFIRAYNRIRGQRVVFIGVNEGEPVSLVRSFAAEQSLPFPAATDIPRFVGAAFGAAALPVTYIIDPDGVIRGRFISELSETQLLAFVHAAQNRETAVVTSADQQHIDALLAPSAFSFVGSPETVLATIERMQHTIGAAEDLLGSRVVGHETDLARTKLEEAALLARAIASLQQIAKSPDVKLLLLNLQGDSSSDKEDWAGASLAYRQALYLKAIDAHALYGYAASEREQYRWSNAVDGFKRLIAVRANTYEYVELAKAYLELGDYPSAVATSHQAVTFATDALSGVTTKNPDLQGWVAYGHLNLAKAYARAGDQNNARVEFRDVKALALSIVNTSPWYAFYSEQAAEGLVALNLGTSETSLNIAPWTGADLPGSLSSTIKYRLTLTGKPGKTVVVDIHGLAPKWIASLCADGICSIMKRPVMMPSSGVKIVELQFIRNAGPAAVHMHVSVTASDGNTSARETISI